MAAFVLHSASQGHPVGVFTLEMSKERLGRRLLAVRTGLPLHTLKLARAYPDLMLAIGRATGEIGDMPIYYFDRRDVTMPQVRSEARRMVRQYGVELILLDYVTLVQAERGQKDDVRFFTYVAEQHKSMARELHVPVVGLAQLSRDVEKRQNKRPGLSDLRESGGFDQAADGVAMLYNANYYKRQAGEEIPGPDEVEFIFVKGRDTGTGVVKLWYQGELTTFSSDRPTARQLLLRDDAPPSGRERAGE